MFNLLVISADGWPASRGLISAQRVLEYTDRHIIDRYEPSGVLDTRAVLELPTVFASENAYDGNQPPARVGTLTRVQNVGNEFRLEYVFDPDIPPIPNSVLFDSAANDLNIDTTSVIPESSRNHWSIKDVDLYKVLLQHGSGQKPMPKVFSLPDEPIDPNLVAVMMPFTAEFHPVYQALKDAIGSLGLECRRADDIWENDHVIQDVAHLIAKASIVVCDLSGRNANVFYETGIAHTIGREVILIAQSAGDVPFDVAAIRHIRYLPNSEGLTKLQAELCGRIETLKARR